MAGPDYIFYDVLFRERDAAYKLLAQYEREAKVKRNKQIKMFVWVVMMIGLSVLVYTLYPK